MNHTGDGLRSPDPLERARAVLARCNEHGFAVAGIAEARPSAHAAAYRAWIAEGKQGGMGYLAEEIERRLDPGVLVPGARAGPIGANPAWAASRAIRAARITTW
ncbi:MAG: hypothetical protein EBU31_03090 [Proteobacteria bacterium]|nr:hypothetical protein [Pseudomonadota bacterium]